MHKTLLYLAFFAITAVACNNDDKVPEEGNNQIQPPVQNSGPETEMERATEAVEQDTTGKEVTPGSDDDKDN